ncbi:MAG: ROK family protein [Armatimonadetes bacterium]|nr:ROK family protein [Armatimonadota bacterium]MDW8121389.1 ROK family protein [Armatimonadota bacterium]
MLALGIDLGGTKTLAAVVSDRSEIMAQASEPTLAEEGGETVLKQIEKAGRSALLRAGLTPDQLSGVGLGTPGIVDPIQGLMLSEAVNIPEWKGRNLKADLERIFQCPAFVENDANAAALGEWRFGSATGAQSLLYITVGTGIGGGLIIEGRLVRGTSFAAGEIGHIPVEPEGPVCGCGRRGCLEALASGPAIAERAQEYLARGVPSLLSEWGTSVSARAIADAAEKGDLLSRHLLATAGKYLGIACAMVVNLLNPDRIAIGGGVAKAGRWLLEPAEWEMRRRALDEAGRAVHFGPSSLGDKAGVLGAAALVFTRPD